MAFTLTIRQTLNYDIVGQEHALNGLALGAMAMQGGGIAGSSPRGADRVRRPRLAVRRGGRLLSECLPRDFCHRRPARSAKSAAELC